MFLQVSGYLDSVAGHVFQCVRVGSRSWFREREAGIERQGELPSSHLAFHFPAPVGIWTIACKLCATSLLALDQIAQCWVYSPILSPMGRILTAMRGVFSPFKCLIKIS